jgi:hypothetical protein
MLAGEKVQEQKLPQLGKEFIEPTPCHIKNTEEKKAANQDRVWIVEQAQ